MPSDAISILTYHSLDASGSVLSVTPQVFADQMACLANLGLRGVTLRAALAEREAAGRWPEGAVVLTFDDGYATVHRAALPVLERHGFTATLFAVTAPLDGASPPAVRLPRAPLMSWQQVEGLASCDWEIGAHTHSHADLSRLAATEVEAELITCKREIEQRLGGQVESFAYPFGALSAQAAAVAARHFRACCTTLLRRATDHPAHALPRIDMYYVRTLRQLERLVTGRWDRYLALRRWGRAVRAAGPAGAPERTPLAAPDPVPSTSAPRTEASSRDAVSIVIAWVNPYPMVVACLDALAAQEGGPPEEIIVVTRHAEGTAALLRRSHPGVMLLAADANAPITALRSIGLGRAHGAVVAVTEDHCVAGPGWLAALRRGLAPDCAILGGPVENACTQRLRDWAAFLTEYAFAIRPLDRRRPATPSSNNVAYRRSLVPGLCATLDGGRWESFFVSEQAARGAVIRLDEQMVMYHRRSFDFRYFVGQRFHFCRSFAGMRTRSLSPLGHLAYGLGSAALPPLLLLRTLRTLLRKRRLALRYLSCLPLIGVYVTVGAIGEMSGYLFGAGSSLECVE